MSVPAAALDRKAVAWGLVGVAVVIALTIIGSDRLAWFDAALVGYLFGLIFAVFGVIYRYSVWLRRPPTAMLNRRGWDAFRERKARNLPSLKDAGREPRYIQVGSELGLGIHDLNQIRMQSFEV